MPDHSIEERIRRYTYDWERRSLIGKVRRESAESAQQVIEALLPEPSSRRNVLTGLVETIKTAHHLSPESWSVTLFENRVRLNVGRAQAFLIDRDAAYSGERQT